MAPPKQIDLKGQGLVILKGMTIVSDPKDDKVKDKNRKTTSNSGPTKDKHRFTVCAPTDDESVFSVGKGASGALAKTGLKHIKDSGITGRTKSHVHFETTGPYGNQTIVSLGKAATDAVLTSHFDPTVPKESWGYAMVTRGPAFANSHDQFYVVSDEGDVQVRAAKKNVGIQASAESVGIEAGRNVAISAKNGSVSIGAASDLLVEDKRWRKELAQMGQALNSKYVKFGAKTLDVVRGILGFSQAFQLPGYEANFGTKGWSTKSDLDVLKVYADAVKLTSTLGRWATKLWDIPGNVSVKGEKYASVSGGLATSIYGGLSASVTSLMSASLLGIQSASVKGIAWTSVWSGIGTSIKSRKDVSVEGQLGKAKLKGKKDVSVESRSGNVNVTADQTLQLNANNGPLHMYSPDIVTCIAGSDAGTAIAADENIILLGLVDSGASSFETAKVNKEKAVVVNKKGILTKFGNASVHLKDSGVFLKLGGSSKVKVAEGTLCLDSSGQILVG